VANNGADKKHKSTAKGSAAALDLGAVWGRGVTLLRDNLQLIATLAAAFVLLPNAALQFSLPADADLQGPLNAAMDPAASQAMQEKAALALGELLGPFLLAAGLVTVMAHIGYAGIVALIGGGRPTVGQALSQALRVIAPLILAVIITFTGIYAALLIVQLVLSPLGPALAAFLGALTAMLALFYFTARLALTLPVMVIEWQLNPVKALLRSWRLTSSHPGNVFGFWMLMAVAWFVTLVMQLAVSILLSSIPGPGPAANLIQGLLSGSFAMVWGSVYCAMGVAMYTALKEPDASEIASDFE
jgi:hypothetical protein